MPVVHLPSGAEIYYETYGRADGFPLLLLAPGGLRSHIALWRHTHDGAPRPWPDPTQVLDAFRIIALDQRNAGRSRAPIRADDGWDTYADDHLGVLDHLGIDRFHVLGSCIGSSFSLKLIARAPDRVAAAVLQQPIGSVPEHAHLRGASFAVWAQEVRQRQPDVDEAALAGFKHNLYAEDFVHSVSRDFVRTSTVPLLILAGDDPQHPRPISEEIARLSPNARYVADWKGPQHQETYVTEITRFLGAATPKD